MWLVIPLFACSGATELPQPHDPPEWPIRNLEVEPSPVPADLPAPVDPAAVPALEDLIDPPEGDAVPEGSGSEGEGEGEKPAQGQPEADDEPAPADPANDAPEPQ